MLYLGRGSSHTVYRNIYACGEFCGEYMCVVKSICPYGGHLAAGIAPRYKTGPRLDRRHVYR